MQVFAGYLVSSCLALLLEIYGCFFSQGGEVFTVPHGGEFSFSLRRRSYSKGESLSFLEEGMNISISNSHTCYPYLLCCASVALHAVS